MKVTVDRIEEGVCVCIDDDERIYNVPLGEFAFEVNPCDILEIELDGKTLVSAIFLREETEAAKERAKKLMERLRNKNRG